MKIQPLHNGNPVSGEKLKMLCQVWERTHELPQGAFAEWIAKATPSAKLAIYNFSNGELDIAEQVAA